MINTINGVFNINSSTFLCLVLYILLWLLGSTSHHAIPEQERRYQKKKQVNLDNEIYTTI